MSRLRIFVLIDALGWELLQRREFLREELPYRTKLRTVLGFSSGAIPTILTGLPPTGHGHWNLFYFDPERSPFAWLKLGRWLPDQLLDNRLSRKLIKELGRRVLGLGPLFECCVSPKLLPFFNWVEKKNIYHAGGITGAVSIFDRLVADQIPYREYDYHQFTDAESFDQASEDVLGHKAIFYFLYLSEMDMYLHFHRKDPVAIEQKLKWYEDRLRKLFTLAQQNCTGLDFAVASDHGMAPVTGHYDLTKAVGALQWRMPEHYLAVYDSTMARFWFFNERAENDIRWLLKGLSCGSLLSDEELSRLGILFPDRRYGEVIFLLSPGQIISSGDFNGGDWMPVGMHGYHPSEPTADAVLLSTVALDKDVDHITGIHDLLLTDLGMAPARDVVA